MRRILHILLFLSIHICVNASLHHNSRQTLDSLLHVYDHELEQADYYIAQRQARIDSVQKLLSQNPTDAELAYAIGELYAPYQCDSTEKYFRMAIMLCPGAVPTRYKNALTHTMERISGVQTVYDNDVEDENTLIEFYSSMDTVSTRPSNYDHNYAIEAYYMSDHYKNNGDKQRQMEWLTRSAIADVRAAVCDNASSWMLAEELYAIGDLERATKYVKYSTRNADIFHARQRYVQVTPVASIITDAYQARLRETSQHLLIAILLLALVLFLLAVSASQVIRRNRRLNSINTQLRHTNQMLDKANHSLDEANRQLEDMNHIREQYICTYLEEKSETIRKAHQQARKAGALDSDEKMKQQLDEFYHRFDTTFLRLYPDFVEQVNNLLEYEGQVHPPKGELTPELRIFALIRMGITRSTRIAELLCYSNNTIYNYRSRLKNYALGDREKFEEEIRKIS